MKAMCMVDDEGNYVLVQVFTPLEAQAHLWYVKASEQERDDVYEAVNKIKSDPKIKGHGKLTLAKIQAMESAGVVASGDAHIAFMRQFNGWKTEDEPPGVI